MPENQIIDEDFIRRYQSDKTIQDFLKLINKKKKSNVEQTCTKSVPSPSAQFAELYEAGTVPDLQLNVNSLLANPNSGLVLFERAVLELQFLYGLRISEILQISPMDIGDNGLIRITGLKGSFNRVVYAVKFKDFWSSMALSGWNIPTSYNRFHFYRLYKKKGLYQTIGSNQNNSVTHLMRYNYLISLLRSNINIDEMQRIIGHKSINSTIHYVEQLKTKRRS